MYTLFLLRNTKKQFTFSVGILILLYFKVYWFTNQSIRVVVNPFYPAYYCLMNQTVYDPLNFYGLEVESTRYVMNRLNLTEGEDFYFDCTYFKDL